MHIFAVTKAINSHGTSHKCWAQVLVTYISLLTLNFKSNVLVFIEIRRKNKTPGIFCNNAATDKCSTNQGMWAYTEGHVPVLG